MSSALSCSLDNDSLANIFSFLEWQEIFKVRVVCMKWKEAAAITPVPIIDITTQVQANELSTITKCLPNTKSLFVLDFGNPDTQYFKIRPGDGFDDNNDVDHYSTDDSVVDISSIQNLKNLGTLSLRHTGLKGGYNYLFHLEQLHHLDLTWNPLLRWDLKQLPPHLKTLRCSFSHNLRGDLKDLKNVLRKNQLQVLVLAHCTQVTGSLEDLYDFVSLEALDIDGNIGC